MLNQTITYKCPSCGGELVYDGKKRAFTCSWCMSVFNDSQIEEIKIAEKTEKEFADNTNVYRCNSCGAEIISDHNTAASFCCFCHNPVTLTERLSGKYRPEMIIPFRFDKNQAIAAFKANCAGKWFLPGDFLSSSQLEKITGLYVPFWLADCDIDAYMIAEAKIVKKYFEDGREVTHTKVYELDRAAKMTYMGVPADASFNIEDSLMDSIEPYDYRGFKEFEMKYLSGFYCDKYDVDKEALFERVRQRIINNTDEVLKNEMASYDSIMPKSKRSAILDIRWHYVLMPVWFMSYKHKGKIYSYAMNGQTAKFGGKYPMSIPKIAAFTLGVSVLSAVLGYFVGGLIF